MRILFLSRWYPYPPSNGSKLRIFNLLRGLAPQHQVTLLSFAEQSDMPVDTSVLESFCQDVQIVSRKPFDPNSRQARLGFFNLSPRSMIDTFSPEMKQCIEQKLSTEDYDVVIVSEVDMAIYSRYIQDIPALLDELQVGLLYERFSHSPSLWRRFRYGLTWAKHRRYLASILKKFQACTVVSNQERQLLSQAVNGYQAIEVIPNCVDLISYKHIREVPQPNTLIFTGSFQFLPNYEAMVWFLCEVYPRIQAQVPDVCLTITGDHANRPLPPADQVNLTGFIDDVRPHIARAWASVVPIFTGGGTRLKILEAMALGTPVVATSKGAEGLDVRAGEHLLIADTPEAFAQAVTRLMKEPELRQQLSNNGYQLIHEKYNWPIVMPYFLDLVERVANS